MKLFFESDIEETLFSSREGERIINIPSRKITSIAKILFNHKVKTFHKKDRRGTYLYTNDELVLIKKFNDMKKIGLNNKMICEVLKAEVENGQPNDTSWAVHLGDAIWRRL